jgi:gluconate 2-dehydrogenase gamma chain
MTSVLADSAIRTLRCVADRLFPADEEIAGGAGLGVVDYVLGQLSGPWGHGERLYREGPYVRPPHPGHGCQSELTPLDAFRYGLAALDEHAVREHGAAFADLPPEAQDALLADLERGAVPGSGRLDPAAFFDLLLDACREGVFADPRHGGNRDGAAWAWIGFPGPRAAGFPSGSFPGGAEPAAAEQAGRR